MHNEELHLFCSSPNTLGDHIRKNEKFRHAAGERRGADRVLMGKPREKDHLEEVAMDGRIMQKWILNN
jgi:hypothetical protein